MTSGRVCVVGSFMMDLVVRAPRRPASGETIVGTSFSTFLGGKGFNQAVAAARAGARTTMVGRVGDDEYGRRFKAHLTHEGIDHEFVVIDQDMGTGIGLPLVEDSGENSIVIIPRCNMAMTVDDVRAAKAVIEASDVLLLQFELPMDAVCEAARLAHDAGTKVVLNPAPAPAPGADVGGLRGIVDLLVPNVTEAAQLAGVDTMTEPEALAAKLRDRFGCDVLITLGSHGALVLDGEGTLLAPTYSVPVLDTVGAGDAFCGTLGTWMANGASLREAVVYANAAGALAVGKEGAEPAMPHREKVLELVNTL